MNFIPIIHKIVLLAVMSGMSTYKSRGTALQKKQYNGLPGLFPSFGIRGQRIKKKTEMAKGLLCCRDNISKFLRNNKRKINVRDFHPTEKRGEEEARRIMAMNSS